jgi:hypothetical protein
MRTHPPSSTTCRVLQKEAPVEKLSLNLSDLQVQSFDVESIAGQRGTVNAASGEYSAGGDETCALYESCQPNDSCGCLSDGCPSSPWVCRNTDAFCASPSVGCTFYISQCGHW